MITLKEYANLHCISYEAVRQQIVKNEDALGDHLVVVKGKRMLDEEGERILDRLRGPASEVVDTMKQNEIIQLRKDRDRLADENREMLQKVNEAMETITRERERIIQLLEEQNKMKQQLFDSEKQILLLEQKQEAHLLEIKMLSSPEKDKKIETLQNEVGAYQDQAKLYMMKAEDERQAAEQARQDAYEALHERDEQKQLFDDVAERLKAERQRREELEQEVNSYEKSIFGLFRKKKKK